MWSLDRPAHVFIVVLTVMIAVAVVYALFFSDSMMVKNPFTDRHLLTRGMDKPVIWLFYTESQVNGRRAVDFGSRSSRALNVPFLNLCYQTIVEHNKDYRVETIDGLAGAAEILGGWERLPPGLRSPLAPVGVAEENYLRAAILAERGGLWLSPSVVSLRGFGPQPADKAVFFGTDLDATFDTGMPGMRAVWAPKAKMPLFVKWAAICWERVATKRGGEQIRGDAKWDFHEFANEGGIVLDSHAEGARKTDGKRLHLEDLLATGTDGHLPFQFPPHTVYVPFSWDELMNRRAFGWFLQMSESQIMESDVAVKYLLKNHGTKP